jgi:hypothetical protein
MIGIDIGGLTPEAQRRIMQVGFDRWLDEQCEPTVPPKPSRYSLETRQARMRKRTRREIRRGRKRAL